MPCFNSVIAPLHIARVLCLWFRVSSKSLYGRLCYLTGMSSWGFRRKLLTGRTATVSSRWEPFTNFNLTKAKLKSRSNSMARYWTVSLWPTLHMRLPPTYNKCQVGPIPLCSKTYFNAWCRKPCRLMSFVLVVLGYQQIYWMWMLACPFSSTSIGF